MNNLIADDNVLIILKYSSRLSTRNLPIRRSILHQGISRGLFSPFTLAIQ